ncbi:MAG: segregation/condensation protein A [Gemmataceae bacterium]
MSAAGTDYQVELDTFRGPLDLLLYLVKRDEIDILDIPIARVADQFKQYLDVLSLIDVERAGDFLVLASTLMEIKSKMLLPRPEETAEPEEDPRRELVRQLLQYKRFGRPPACWKSGPSGRARSCPGCRSPVRRARTVRHRSSRWRCGTLPVPPSPG